MSGGPTLTAPCPTATGGAAGLCIELETVCFDVGPSPLLLFTVFDCDPGSATSGQIIASDYRDPNNPSTVVVPTGTVIPCPGAVAGNLDPEFEYLCDNNGMFMRVYVLDVSGAVIGTPLDFDLAGAAYTVVGPVRRCSLAYEDHILIDAAGPFIRRITITDGVPTVQNYLLDGATPYTPLGPVTLPEFDQIVLCDVDLLGNATPFIRVIGPNGVIINDVNPITGGNYSVVGTPGFCESREIKQTELCEYDAASGLRLGEFIRRWVIDSASNLVVAGPAEFELDGVTPYVISGTSVTRNCENEVGCVNDPCFMGTGPLSSQVVTNGPTPTAFTSLQIDQPGTSNGFYKLDLFEDDFTAGAAIGVVPALLAWLQSGPGGVLPPRDEVFVWDGIQGRPDNAPIQGAPNLPGWVAPGRFVIPGWMVVDWANVSTNPTFLEIRFDTNIVNPQNCPLDVIDVPGLGITLDVLIGTFLGNIDDAIVANGPTNAIGGGAFNSVQPFEIGTAAVTDTLDIYQLQSTEAVQATSVVLCQTVTSRVVCFSGEDQPLVSVEGLNGSGQTVFGPIFKNQLDGTIVNPSGLPVECGSNARYEVTCGDCTQQVISNQGADGNQFQLSVNNSSPISRSMVIDFTTNITIIPALTAFLQNADQRDIFTVNTVQGPTPWVGNTVPMVIPRWLVQNFTVTPTQVAIDLNDTLAHPEGCDVPQSYTNWITQRLTPAFLNWGAGSPRQISVNGANQYITTRLANFDGGPALRVVECCTKAEFITLCDVQADGSVVEFLRNLAHECGGNLVPEADYTLDGSNVYVPIGNVADCSTVALTTCEIEECLGLALDPILIAPTDATTSLASGAFTAPFNVTIDYSFFPTYADDFVTCVNSGGYMFSTFNMQSFGNVQLAFGGVGLTNLVNTAGVLTFTFDPNASLADVAANCPAALNNTSPALQDVLNTANTFLGVLPFLGGSDPIIGATRYRCGNLVSGVVTVPANRVEVCNLPLADCGCDAVLTDQQAPYPGGGADTIQVDFNITPEVFTWTINEGATPIGLVQDLIAWLNGTGDAFIWSNQSVLGGNDPFMVLREQVVFFASTATSVTITQSFEETTCDLASTYLPITNPPGVPLSLLEDRWKATLQNIVATVGQGVATPLIQAGGTGVFFFDLVNDGTESVVTRICNTGQLAGEIAQALAVPAVNITRTPRALQVNNGTITLNGLNALSIEWVVTAGTVTYDGVTFNVGEGMSSGSDANTEPLVGASLIDGTSGSFRLIYTEVS